MWSSAASRQINYGVPTEMGMFVLAQSNNQHISDHHHHHHHHVHGHSLNPTAAAGATALGVGVIPLLTATPCLTAAEEGVMGNRSGRVSNSIISGSNNINHNIQFWQPQQSYIKKNMFSDHGFSVSGGGGGGGALGSTSGSTLTCQDCGNQAKKDCNHRRCRTCCKNRGFDCPTHVKSTWVPAARRRERQLVASTGAVSSASTSGTKKPRLTSRTTTTSHTSTSNNNTPPRSFDTSTSSHHQDASFMQSLPGQVRAPAVFKCVRVTAVEDGGDDEYAYQASVTIGGHVFKGFLYDQGVETRGDHTNNNIPNFSELHLGGGSGRNVGGSLTSPSLDTPPVVYGSSTGGGLLG